LTTPKGQWYNQTKGGKTFKMVKGNKITNYSPLEGTLNFLASYPLSNSFREDALNDKVEDIAVDTVCASDTGIWETGIKRESVEGKWVIVEQYEDIQEAEEGHQKWLKLMTEQPDAKLEDIDMWNLGL